ncbi:MAG: hypothetical protein WC533_04255 [Candidatus Pacearchaeota archaeon]
MSREQFAGDQVSYEIALKIRDLEESQRLMKQRLLLIGQNLIESQEKVNDDLIEIKKQLQDTKSDLKRVSQVMETFSEEVAKSARKEEVAILSRQIKMFSPLKYARVEDVENIVHKKINKHKETENNEEKSKNFWEGKI